MLKARYEKGTLFQLFLITAFPIHVWAMVLLMRDMDWVIERFNGTWDVVGYFAYSLSFTLLESLLVFVCLLPLGLLLPWGWKKEKYLASVSLLYLVVMLWGYLGQVYYMVELVPPGLVWRILYHLNRLGWWTFGPFLLGVAASVVLPLLAVARYQKVERAVNTVFERLMILSGFYLFFDLAAVIVLVIRNVGGA